MTIRTIIGMFDERNAKTFRKTWRTARDEGRESFQWEGHPVLVALAKYVDEYLVMQKLLKQDNDGKQR